MLSAYILTTRVLFVWPIMPDVMSFPLHSAYLSQFGWLVVLGLTAFETVFQSISDRLPERGRKKKEMIDKRKNVQTTPTCTYSKSRRPLPYPIQISRTPRHWKFTQHHRKSNKKDDGREVLNGCGWLVGWLLGFNGPLGQYFSLYRAVSQREGERGEKDRCE